MDPERWRRVNDIFQGAIARDESDRDAFVSAACGDDEALRAEVQRLVRADALAAGFLDVTVVTGGTTRESSTPAVHEFSAYHVGDDFRGTDRFTVRRRLGAGGMGIAYEAYDRERGETIALKTLLRTSAADILRLKREFRALADIAHPNLVCLYELVVDGDVCFFTMELVDGVGIADYVRAGSPVQPSGGTDVLSPPMDPERTRSALRQLIAGVSALHRHGKLHRDIKPSNILVTSEGRLVILDFGLVSDVLPGPLVLHDRAAGTFDYLAPERLDSVPAAEASDWYSVGVTLFEVLTGRVPFQGSYAEARARKREVEAPSAADISPDIPDDLRDICAGFLIRDPSQRWSGREALARLEWSASLSVEAIHVDAQPTRSPFVGRVRHLQVLANALADTRAGRAAAVHVHGSSGIGKSALVQHFLDQVATAAGDAIVLRGRCYERESVPYKALDGIVDSLSVYLSALPSTHTETLIPRDAGALVRAFPVMLQVEAIARAARTPVEDADPSAQRRAAFSALRELLKRLATDRTTILYVDDLQWADPDSGLLLAGILQGSDPPPLLMVACVRDEEVASKPFLQALLGEDAAPYARALPLGPMNDDEARALTSCVIPPDAAVGEHERSALVREAGGNPFLLEQLAQHLARPLARLGGITTFADVLDDRVRQLPDGAQRFLDVLSVCGRPMAPELIHAAAGLAGDERPLVARLRAEHLVRASGSASQVELYHDRIRESLAARLSPDLTRDIHRVMVQTLTARALLDPEVLFEHYRGAGDNEGAAAQAALAAEKAHSALAFERAASFYRAALALSPRATETLTWTEHLANALANAGRPEEAAAVYLDAASGSFGPRRIDLERRAAEQFLIGGHIDRGMQVIRKVLRQLRMRLASGPRAALASILWWRAVHRWRGLRFTPRSVDRVPAERLLQLDTCWSVTMGLAMVDSVRAAEFNTRHLRLALDAGEPYRVARALIAEATFLKGGGRDPHYAAACAEQAAQLAEQCGHPHAKALAVLQDGMATFLSGEWKQAIPLCDRALQMLRAHGAGAWELTCAESFSLYALLFQGEIRRVAERLPSLLAAAADRGNLYYETELRTRMNLVWLANDQPDEGERAANEAMERWSHDGFHRQHYTHVLARIQTALYRGQGEIAWQLVTDNWRNFDRALIAHVHFQRVETLYLRARSALLLAASGHATPKLLSVARADARRLHRVPVRSSAPIAMLIEAAAAYVAGNRTDARAGLASAIDAFDAADMRLYAEVSRRRLGMLQEDETGRSLLQSSEAWMAEQGIKNPARMCGLIAPGFDDSLAGRSTPGAAR